CSDCRGDACSVSTGIAPPAPAAAAACSASATGSEPRSGSAPGPSPSDGPFPDDSDEDCSSSGRALSDEACSEAEACASEPDSRLSSTPMACPSTVTSGWDWLLDAAAIEAIVARARARLSASSSRRWTSLPFSSEESPSCSFTQAGETVGEVAHRLVVGEVGLGDPAHRLVPADPVRGGTVELLGGHAEGGLVDGGGGEHDRGGLGLGQLGAGPVHQLAQQERELAQALAADRGD